MAINAVNSSVNAMQQQATSERQTQFQPSERPQRPQSSESSQASEARQVQAQRRTEQAQSQERQERPQRVEQPKPVVNAQGQKAGTIINTSA